MTVLRHCLPCEGRGLLYGRHCTACDGFGFRRLNVGVVVRDVVERLESLALDNPKDREVLIAALVGALEKA